MQSLENPVYFAPVVVPLVCEDHFPEQAFSMAYSLPVGATGKFSPLGHNQIEIWASGWDKPMRIVQTVEQQKWEPGLHGLDQLLYYCSVYGVPVPGFRLELGATDPSINPFCLLVPLVLNYINDTVQEFSTPLKARWISRVMSGVQCDAQAYGWADLSPDHIFLYNREEDTCLIAPDPLSGWQKILIRVPGPFHMLAEKNNYPFSLWADTVRDENTAMYFQYLRRLSIHTGNVAVQNMISRMGGHEAQGIALPLSEGHHHYILSYVHPRAVNTFLDFCEHNCRSVFKQDFTIHMVEENLSLS